MMALLKQFNDLLKSEARCYYIDIAKKEDVAKAERARSRGS